MTINSLGALAVLTIRNPAEAARQLLTLKPGREVLWLAFALAVVLNCLVQLGINMAVPVVPQGQPSQVIESMPVVLLRSAGAMMLSIVAFFAIGRTIGGKASFDDLMVLTIWLQFLQIAGFVVMLLLSLTMPFLMMLTLFATAILSIYITLHFLNVAHQFGSLWKSFAVIVFSALVAVSFVLFLSPAGPV
ncbi:YIP1 family protein [uncultured Ruegeria sp.]|uniref:YIP1 family protein n=1 Tax=uncultured Ruegeria sp. TaxID=259304 RepID=UPI0026291069|nr:YIP1 family protein [uncultured Ruegeria sp.]